ncbi:MAG: GNAT family N-acetyltransferase [Acidobacteriia bacterium]|nr:GNAT family N-acetyltransferase [Terriglobia bacterium]
MNSHFQLASEKDLTRLTEMMREFYRHEGIRFDDEVARTCLFRLFRDPAAGTAYVILVDETPAGYFVLTFPFSLEFHGKFALLDELYIREPFRRQHLGRAVLEFAEGICRKTGIQALRLEAAHGNNIAHALYNSMGFQQDMRHLFTKWM